MAAILDGPSRKVRAGRLSNTLETRFCLECLEEALRQGQPRIFNTESRDAIYQPCLERLWRSVKYEEVYPKAYDTLDQIYRGLDHDFTFLREYLTCAESSLSFRDRNPLTRRR